MSLDPVITILSFPPETKLIQNNWPTTIPPQTRKPIAQQPLDVAPPEHWPSVMITG
jgi:hypothetical protein